jgi:AhpD family alkylhydroperoxidase
MTATTTLITPRIDPTAYLASGAGRAMLALQHQVETSGLDHTLLELVKIRASQINGCAYCIDMHTKDARAAGETEQRIYALSAWHETPFFSERERAALAWTESVTNVSTTHVPDDVHDHARKVLGEADLVALTWAVVAINAWNRLAVAFRAPVGTYTARKQPHASA